MVDRVADFYDQYTDIGQKLAELTKVYNRGAIKLQPSGRSITTSANQVIGLGAKLSKRKELNVPEPIAEIIDTE
jgi:hypothetical protein